MPYRCEIMVGVRLYMSVMYTPIDIPGLQEIDDTGKMTSGIDDIKPQCRQKHI